MENTSKHITLPAQLYNRVSRVAEQTGAPFSRLVLAALNEMLPLWEKGLAGFYIDNPQTFEHQVRAYLQEAERKRSQRSLNELLGKAE
ncbi:hypothetical protein [Pseudodesulfovibrio karagichevae]|uniref:Uncharacterized protein n=1 Tax=Pseudodesulfovibrio karagichevae TaxID=3239305 RepID=A0ABV4K5S0_9BACT